MIERLQIERFKSLRSVDIRLGRLNLFLGTNASGKSNLFDAFRVLQGIGYGFTVDEILNGKPKSATSEIWEGVRGGSAKALFAGQLNPEDAVEPTLHFTVTLAPSTNGNGGSLEYSIAIAPELGCVREERLTAGGKDIFTSNPSSAPISNPSHAPVLTARYYSGSQRRPPHLDFEKSRPVLQQIQRHDEFAKKHDGAVASVIRELSNMQRLDPSPAVLRSYSQAQLVKRMGERGENFAALVKAICADEKTKRAYLTWLHELTPTDVDDVGVLLGALGEPLFSLKENGREFPAPVLSDGTLRFAAITAAFFQPDMPGILTIEEIENGIHANRLRLLIELLRSQAAREDVQIMVTTHSPIVLSWLKDEEYATTFYCKHDDVTGESRICPLTELKGFTELVARQPISDLFAEGWMESAL